MYRVGRLGPALLAIIGLSAVAPVQAASRKPACTAERRAELPVTVLRNFLLVPASLDGGKVLMVVDTGAEASTVTPEAVAGLGLAWQPSATMLLGVAGAVHGGGTVRLRQIELGGLTRHGLELGVGRLPPFAATGRPVAGLLGADMLGAYDVELDPARRSMGVYAVPPCPNFVPPGFEPADGHALQTGGSGLLFVAVQVDGHPVRALLDTGARSTLVTPRVAARLGVTDAELARDPLVPGSGIGGNLIGFRRHRFREIRVGSLAVRDMVVNIAALPIPGIEMLLGADWFGAHRTWISRAAGRLFQR